MATITPTQIDIRGAIREFMLSVLPTGVDVIIGQQNRAGEPKEGTFVVMTPIRFNRLSTNVDSYDDVVFTGTISGDTLTVTAVQRGVIQVGRTLFGSDVTAGTIIQAAISGTGGAGTYTLSESMSLTSRVLSAGAKRMKQSAEVTVQCDFHDAETGISADLAQIVTTAFGDDYAYQQMADQSGSAARPLYANQPTQRPFINENQQYEWRWVVELTMQTNQTVEVPMQFADSMEVTPISVDVEWPA